ncbi:restriction endonuclease subunit S [Weissella confusa]
MKTIKKIPAMRFSGFTEEWEERKLGDEVRIVMGQSPNSENYTDDPNDYILVQGNADMKNGRVFPRVWTTQVTKQAEKDDLILSVRAPVGDIGKTAYDVVIGRGVAAIKGNEFIFQNLGKMKSDGYWTRYSTGSTFESINSTDIKEAIISVPAIEEQNKIGSFFKQLDNTIALHQRKLDLLKEQKKGYLQKMFPKNGEKVPELRFAGFADDWEERKLGELGKTKSGIGFPDSQQGGSEGTPFYKVSDMNNPENEVVMTNANNYVSDSQIKDNKWKPINPNNSGVVFAKVGAAIFLDRKRIVDTSFLIDNNMMSYLFNSAWNRYFGKTLFEKLRLSRFAQVGALPSFNGSDLEDIKVTIPGTPEQNKIGSFFTQLDNTITLHQRKLDLLKEQKKGYLQKMFV